MPSVLFRSAWKPKAVLAKPSALVFKSAPVPPAVFSLSSLTSLLGGGGGPPQLNAPPSVSTRPATTTALLQILFLPPCCVRPQANLPTPAFLFISYPP